MHWNLGGEPDAWADRRTGSLLIPALAAGVWLLFRVLPTIDPRRQHYSEFSAAYWAVANTIILVLAALEAALFAIALGLELDMNRVALLLIGVILVSLGFILPRIRPNRWFGVRTPWTLKSERVWMRTHRQAGPVFVISGITTATSTLLSYPFRLWIAGAALFAAVLIPAIYSYLLFRYWAGPSHD